MALRIGNEFLTPANRSSHHEKDTSRKDVHDDDAGDANEWKAAMRMRASRVIHAGIWWLNTLVEMMVKNG